MANEQALKAKQAFISILNALYKSGQLPSDVGFFFKLVATKVKPVLLYGSELWGHTQVESVEIVNKYACKVFVCKLKILQCSCDGRMWSLTRVHLEPFLTRHLYT